MAATWPFGTIWTSSMAADAMTSAGAARVNQLCTASCVGGGPDSTKVTTASDGWSAPRSCAPKEAATEDTSSCARICSLARPSSASWVA